MKSISLREALEANENITLRKLAIETSATYNVLLKASKAPIEGEIYDPTKMNYDEVEKKLIAKIGIENFNKIDWNDLNEKSTKAPSIKVNVKVGNEVILRDKKAFYVVIFKTSTHIVIMAEDSTSPRAMSNGTFEHLGGRIANENDVLINDEDMA